MVTIIAQIDKFVKNSFSFELVLKKEGSISIKTAIIKIAEKIWSIIIFFSKNYLLFERIF